MPLMIRRIGADESLSAHLALDALGDIIPPSAIAEVIAQHEVQEELDRKLPAAATLVLCIAMNLYPQEALPAVFQHLVTGLRWLWPDRSDLRVSKNALSQAQLVGLCECGTHALCDAGLWPCAHDKEAGMRRLLRSVTPGMLVLSNMGLHSFDLLAATLTRGGHVLNRVPAQVKPRQ